MRSVMAEAPPQAGEVLPARPPEFLEGANSEAIVALEKALHWIRRIHGVAAEGACALPLATGARAMYLSGPRSCGRRMWRSIICSGRYG